MISFEDLILKFYILVPNIAIEGTMENFQFKQHFCYNAQLYCEVVALVSSMILKGLCLGYIMVNKLDHKWKHITLDISKLNISSSCILLVM